MSKQQRQFRRPRRYINVKDEVVHIYDHKAKATVVDEEEDGPILYVRLQGSDKIQPCLQEELIKVSDLEKMRYHKRVKKKKQRSEDFQEAA
jgi:hypothetical protein